MRPCAPQRGRGGVRDRGFVFQPAEPRCLSDKLSAVNIGVEEGRQESWEAALAGRQEVAGGTGGGSHP